MQQLYKILIIEILLHNNAEWYPDIGIVLYPKQDYELDAIISRWGYDYWSIAPCFAEVKIRDPWSVPGSIPELNKWGSRINPRT